MEKVEKLLSDWYKAKKLIQKYEDDINEYKVQADYLLKSNKLSELKSQEYFLELKKMKRKTVCKKDLTPEIWDKYAKEHEYESYYIMEIDKKFE